jgi:hypothetical protein
MHDLFATASEHERRLSRIAAEVWNCAPYTDHDGTRYPLAMQIMGITTAWHPEDAHGIHAVQCADAPGVHGDAGTPATVLHGSRDITPPMPWTDACRHAHALVRAACALPSTRPPEDEEIAFSHLMEDHWAMADEDGIRVTLMRFMDEDAEPVTDPPFWNVVVLLDGIPITNREVRRWHASYARTVAARLFNVFEGSGRSLRALADTQGWGAVRAAFGGRD